MTDCPRNSVPSGSRRNSPKANPVSGLACRSVKVGSLPFNAIPSDTPQRECESIATRSKSRLVAVPTQMYSGAGLQPGRRDPKGQRPGRKPGRVYRYRDRRSRSGAGNLPAGARKQRMAGPLTIDLAPVWLSVSRFDYVVDWRISREWRPRISSRSNPDRDYLFTNSITENSTHNLFYLSNLSTI